MGGKYQAKPYCGHVGSKQAEALGQCHGHGRFKLRACLGLEDTKET